MQSILKGFYVVRQAIFAGLVLCLVLIFYNKFSNSAIFNAIGLASLASTIFIVFIDPDTMVGHPRSIIGGYLLAILIGIGGHYLSNIITHPHFTIFNKDYFLLITGSLTLTLCIITMVILEMPHQPAAGFAVGIVVDRWEPQSLIIMMLIILCLTLIKSFLHFKPLIK